VQYFAKYMLAIVLSLGVSAFGQVRIGRAPDRLTVEVQGKPFTDLYITGAETTKPYFHPLRSASGIIVTRRYPMEIVEGESHDNPHQRGLWFGHGNVNGFDFWDNEASDQRPNLGRIILDRVIGLASDEKQGSIKVSFQWVASNGKPLIEDTREITFYSDPVLRIMDFKITLRAIEKVTFGDTKEGTFAMHVAPFLEEASPNAGPLPERTGRIVNSNGQEGEKGCWGKRADWVDRFGEVGGEKLGVAIFDYSGKGAMLNEYRSPAFPGLGNPRHPTYWHVRGYGLFAANIFGVREFESNPALDGSLTLEPGKTLNFRYRVVVHPGDYLTANIAGLYEKYTWQNLAGF